MKNKIILVSAVALLLYSCATTAVKNEKQDNNMPEQIDATLAQNPFLKKSTLQYQAPEFDKIKDEHYKPAFDYGLKQHLLEIQQIADNPKPATFENTLEAMETSGEVLKRAQIVFYNLTGSNTNPTLQKLEEEYAPIFAEHSDKIYLNSKLYNRIKSIDASKLKGEQKRILEISLQNFEIAGAGLSDADKEELKKINQELATLSTQFSNKLLDARKDGAVIIADVKELDGLSEDEIQQHKLMQKKPDSKGNIFWLCKIPHNNHFYKI